MFRLLLVALLCFGAWKGYEAYQTKRAKEAATRNSFTLPANPQAPSATFSCDGRKYCSQMSSCAEAKYFLKNCPDVKMDGNNDGLPCEQQWCK